MESTLQALGIDKMTIDERIALATAIWNSIGAEPHSTLLTETQRQELERRVDDHEANPDDVVHWERIKADALARFQ